MSTPSKNENNRILASCFRKKKKDKLFGQDYISSLKGVLSLIDQKV